MAANSGSQNDGAGNSLLHEEEQCSTRLSCARAQSKRGALYDVHGMIGCVCIHGIPLLGTFCDLRGPENFVYYMVRSLKNQARIETQGHGGDLLH